MNKKISVSTLTLLAICMSLMAIVFFAYAEAVDQNPEEKPMVILITSYNNKEWYKQNLESALLQKYHNYRIIFVDDASPDGTGNLVNDLLKEHDYGKKISVVQNSDRMGALANIYHAVQTCNKNEIIVSLDGDDWLANENVLAHLNKVYSDPNVWLTYGQFAIYPGNTLGFAFQVPEKVIEERSFRENGGGITHLRTFYAGLFQLIKKEDMLYEGKFYSMSWDMAILLPMCEMAGNRIKFIPEVLYIYNMSNPINDEKVDRSLQLRLDHAIRKKEKYPLLTTAPF